MKQQLLDFLAHLFSDSSKDQLQNVCGFITVITLIVIAFINQLLGKPIEAFIYESLVTLAVGCIGVNVVSYFKPGNKTNTTDQNA